MTHSHRQNQAFGEDIAFGIQQTAACWATDFIDPFVSAWVQKRLGDKNSRNTLAHALKGEVAGDSAAFFIFLATQKWLPAPAQGLKRFALRHFGNTYGTMARSSLSAWKAEHQLQDTSPEYQQKIEEYKEFQANNFARSAVISIASTASNVAVQKMVGNRNSITAITASKSIGAAITMGVVLTSRIALPRTTHRLDKEMDRRFISPLIQKTQKLLGATTADESNIPTTPPATYVEKIRQTQSARTL